jgi:hypothetical protein
MKHAWKRREITSNILVGKPDEKKPFGRPR